MINATAGHRRSRPASPWHGERRKYAAFVVALFVILTLLVFSIRKPFLKTKLGNIPSSLPPLGSPQSLTENLGNGVLLELVQLPSGEFKMGSNDGEGEDDERPKHKVKVDSFAIGRYEITQAQWKALMGTNDNPSRFSGYDNLPVENVLWDMAQEFIKQLQQKTGQRSYRLPTESEWEYAARAGSTNKWSFDSGEDELPDYAWYSKNASGRTHPVGAKRPNKWGLFDMHGNVMELCQDWYDQFAYTKNDTHKPLREWHVLRGGCIVCTGDHCRASYRDFDESKQGKHVGFRVARQ